jgi:hypothetical protein
MNAPRDWPKRKNRATQIRAPGGASAARMNAPRDWPNLQKPLKIRAWRGGMLRDECTDDWPKRKKRTFQNSCARRGAGDHG